MATFNCNNCGKKFFRYTHKGRNYFKIVCSRLCRAQQQKIDLLGSNNPNYKYGAKESRCNCGEPKDYRSKKCAKCSKRGYTKEGAKIRMSEEEMKNIILSSESFLEASKKCSVSRTTLVKFAKRNNISLLHMVKCNNRKFSPEEILVVTDTKSNRNCKNTTVKRVLIENKLLEYKCSLCSQGSIWNGKKLTIQLDHINGNNQDNRLENLRFLCPNCHTQQSTSFGANVQRRKNRGEKYRQ